METPQDQPKDPPPEIPKDPPKKLPKGISQAIARVIPMDPLVAEMVELLSDSQQEDFEERAGIIEFDANVPRAHAECLALLDVLRRNPAVLTGVHLVQVVSDGQSQWQLTVAPDSDQPMYDGRLADLLREHFDSSAALTAVR